MSCETQLNYFNASLSRRELWAIRMLDMYAKLPPGILHRGTRQFGLFTECLDFRHESTVDEVGVIEGQYCTLNHASSSIGAPIDSERLTWRDIGLLARQHNLRFETGICVPATCKASQVRQFANSWLGRADLVLTGNPLCQVTNQISLSILDYFVIFIIAFLILATIVSTIYEIKMRKRLNEAKMPLTLFSLYSNMKILLHVDYTKSPKMIECFNGLRALSAYGVIAGHRAYRNGRMTSRPMTAHNFVGMIIGALFTIDYPVDIFFLVSSILVSLSCLKLLDSKKLSPAKMYFNRYIRFLLPFAALMLFMLSFLPHALVSGPQIRFLETHIAYCQNYWWSALLMIQNYVNPNDVCLIHTWYLNADLQLFIVSPVFVFFIWKFGFKSFWLIGIVIISIQVSIFFGIYNKTVSEFIIYRQAHYRLGQWLVGICLGYIMYTMQQGTNQFKIRRKGRKGKGGGIISELPYHRLAPPRGRMRSKYIWWITTMTLFILTQVYYELLKPQRFVVAFYEATHRIVAVVFFGWIIFAFHHLRSGNIFRYLLSHPLWQPIARLSLSIYLVHDIYIIMAVTNLKELSHYDISWFLHIIAGDLVISTILASLLFLFVEVPAGKLLNHFMK